MVGGGWWVNEMGVCGGVGMGGRVDGIDAGGCMSFVVAGLVG